VVPGEGSGSPTITTIKKIDSTLFSEIEDSIDHDNITLIEAIRAVTIGVYKPGPIIEDDLGDYYAMISKA